MQEPTDQPTTQPRNDAPEQPMPCPFCHSSEVSLVHYLWVECAGCGADGPVCDTISEAVEAWNRATAPLAPMTSQQELLEVCEEVLPELLATREAFEPDEPDGDLSQLIERLKRIISNAKAGSSNA